MIGKAAALGNADFVMPFASLGLESFATDNDAQNVRDNATKILKEKFSLVVVAEDIAHEAQEIFAQADKESLPCVVVVPFTKEPEGFAVAELGRVLKMATGIDIINN